MDRPGHVGVTASDPGSGTEDQSSAVFLRIHGDGSFSLVDERIDAPTLEARINAHLGRNPAQAVVVHPDGEVKLQELIDVLDRLTEMGVAHLTLG